MSRAVTAVCALHCVCSCVQGVERMFGVLVSRTAGLLANRLGGGSLALPSGSRPVTPAAARAAAAAAAAGGAGGAATAVLMQMNERLAAENAQLLAELARWQSGRHGMLRKMGMSVLGAEPPPPPSEKPLTHEQKIAQALAAVTGGARGGASGQGRQSTSGASFPGSSAGSFGGGAGDGVGGGVSAAAALGGVAGGGGSAQQTAAREALAAAAREVLLAGRKELLPAVMTAEGWGEGAAPGGLDTGAASAALHGGKAEAALVTAESVLRLRTQVRLLERSLPYMKQTCFCTRCSILCAPCRR